MPTYIYESPVTGEVREVVQKMTDVHEYEENGVKFKRVFVNPRWAVDTQVNPFSQKDFLKRTNKRMTYGDMMDESAELSEKRATKAGKDPVKEKAISDYEKKTKKPHPSKAKGQRIETKDYVIET